MNATTAAHLRRAVENHRRWCRDAGLTMPSELPALVDLLAGEGQGRTSSLIDVDPADDAGVPIAVDYSEAGRLLGGISAKTVSRLVRTGRLRAISVGSARRVPRAELERFVAEQMETPTGAGAARPTTKDATAR